MISPPIIVILYLFTGLIISAIAAGFSKDFDESISDCFNNGVGEGTMGVIALLIFWPITVMWGVYISTRFIARSLREIFTP